MSQQKSKENTAKIEVENIGGIDETDVELDPGITILTGRNATNRTSFLQAVMAVMGSENATLKADADEGKVRLDFQGESYSRTLSRSEGRVLTGGDPYLQDSMLADLFAFLLESNECRQAVARGDDLHELIMRPVDTNEIEREIRSLEDERDKIEERISELNNVSEKLPSLYEKKEKVKSKIEEKKSELANKESEFDDIDKSIEKSRAENEELDTKMSELQGARRELKTTERDIESERESIEALQSELEDQQEAFDGLSPVSEDRLSELTQEAQRIRGKIEAIDQNVNEIQSIITFNESFLQEGEHALAEQLQSEETNSNDVTDQLLESKESVACWTCGTVVGTEQIESNLDRLRTLRQEKVQQSQSLTQDVQDIEEERKDLKTQQDRYERLQQRIRNTENEITERQETIRSLTTQKEEIQDRIQQLESDVEALQREDHSEVLNVQEQINHLEFELDDLTSELSSVNDEIDNIEGRLENRDNLENKQKEIQDELEGLRTRVENIQKQAVEEFNEHMDSILELLDYDNLERIWIDQSQERIREGRKKVEKDRFNLHIVRSTESGTVYEDTIDHLSESEREVTGLIFALAGYLVHDVHETVPFMLIDSIEAIDAGRIADLVEYLKNFADYLVVALLNEDAAALDSNYPRISSI